MGRVLCTNITEVNLSTFAYRLFHEDFSSVLGSKCSGISTISILFVQQRFGRDSIWVALVISDHILVEISEVLGGKSLLISCQS